MTDPRMEKLADLLVRYSCKARRGDNVLIEAIDIPDDFTNILAARIHAAGARPFVFLKSTKVNRALMLAGSHEQWRLVADVEKLMMKNMQCYIGVRGNANISELSDVPSDKQKLYEKNVWRHVHQEIRVRKTRWVVLRWPNPSMAQMAEMSTQAFEDFYFRVCTLDYAKMSRAMRPLKALMQRTDKVRLKGPRDTDLTFRIKGIPAIPCDGRMNIPDGEVFTAPVRDSVNGVIHFNCPTIYRGATHNDIRLVFEDGRIVEASSTNTARLNEVFDTDPGARYVGEFAIGVNPHIIRAMKDILFDEKIAGSIHFTPGACYDEASNGNKSAIHWDLVLKQTPDVGGGEMYFDGKLIRKNGRFIPRQLQPLNPERLK